MTGAQGWVWFYCALDMEAAPLGGPMYKRTTDAYVRKEAKKLLAGLKKK